MNPVLTKRDMYMRLAQGEFGNTTPRYFDVYQWGQHGAPNYELWGVRHTALSGFPGTRMNVNRDNVFNWVQSVFGGRDYEISPMIEQLGRVLWEGDVTVRYASGRLNPEPGTWRQHMLRPTEWRDTTYRTVFRHLMAPDSYDDLMLLLDAYPDHVVELSILDRCCGTVKGRNAIVWEVRAY